MKAVTLVLLVAVTFLGTAMAAQNEVHLKNGEGITAAMERAGCGREWLSVVMAENNLSVRTLRGLPVGFSFRLPASCDAKAPQAVQEKSLDLMAFDRELSAQAALRRENAALNSELVRIRASFAELEKEVHDQNVSSGAPTDPDIEVFRKRISELTTERDQVILASSRIAWRSGVIGAFFTALTAPLVWVGWRRKLAFSMMPLEVTKRFSGLRHVFQLEKRTYRCACGVGGLDPKNFKRHLEKAENHLHLWISEEEGEGIQGAVSGWFRFLKAKAAG